MPKTLFTFAVLTADWSDMEFDLIMARELSTSLSPPAFINGNISIAQSSNKDKTTKAIESQSCQQEESPGLAGPASDTVLRWPGDISLRPPHPTCINQGACMRADALKQCNTLYDLYMASYCNTLRPMVGAFKLPPHMPNAVDAYREQLRKHRQDVADQAKISF
ncbi:hypothetical protein IWX49DRAFT_594952 [Phyllosticta citricarpa]|uniref:Uncharacterized protein n=1 Tax=Phyllosticta citricarpa TaxID=55181 RepID=A0ABR1LFW4_9PEZI